MVKFKDGELSLSISKYFDANTLFGIDLSKIKTVKITLPTNCDETMKKKVHYLLMCFLALNMTKDLSIQDIFVFCKDIDTIDDLVANSYGAPMPNALANLLYDDNEQFIGASFSLPPDDFPDFRTV